MECWNSLLRNRWIRFHDAKSGFEVNVTPLVAPGDKAPECYDGWGFSASYYSTENLASHTHDYELQPDADSNIYVHVDRHMMGIGGFDSWSPNVEPEFVLKSGRSIHCGILIAPHPPIVGDSVML